jgi:hypothetical protein
MPYVDLHKAAYLSMFLPLMYHPEETSLRVPVFLI